MKRIPLKRSARPMLRRVPVKRKRAKPRRVSVFRSRPYLDWLKERRCVVCELLKMIYRDRLFASGAGPIDPAHGPPAGLRVKGPDNEAIPLCRCHHEEQTNVPGGWPAFEAKYGFSRSKKAAVYFSLWGAFSLDT